MTHDYMQDPLIGQQLDEYRLDAVLGQGGMARVYRGFDVRLKRPTAIKVIQGSFRASPEYEARFEREAQAIARLRHPNIVGVYRYSRMNDLFYLAMEYIEGEDLQARLAAYQAHQKLMPLAEAGRIIRQVCLALDYAHSQGVIHRDVKPSNIMLDKQGQALLTDFGLALLDRNTQGEIFGTPDYIAPEQAMSSAGAVPQSDLYAVGVILYEIFTGQLPFTDPEPLALAMRHLTDPPRPPRILNSNISLGLEAVILKALAKDAQDRYPSGAMLSEALDAVLRLIPQEATSQDKRVEPPLPPIPAGIMSQPAENETPQTLRYRWTNIRSLLMEGFSAEELLQLCFDEFRPVYNQLSVQRSKTEIVELLLEYTDQALLVDKLLALAQKRNPARYEKHQPYQEKFASRPSLIGTTLGPYIVGEWLGQGGMAEVYKAYDSHLNRQVAVKVIHDHLNDDVEFVERFENEAIMLAGLRHPNIVQVIDRDQTERFHYMVMEFVPGRSLEAKLKERQAQGHPFTPAEAVPIVEELASAIDYAHNQGVIHHDLKPNNILFTADGQIVLTDFGIARILALPNYTVPGLVLGTPAYMAPEQARGQRGDPRSDVYSLGVLLYEMMTGRVPLNARTPWEMVMKYTGERPPSPASINPAISPAVERVILKALSQSPDKRYQTARGLARALAKAVKSPKQTPPISPPPSSDFTYDVFISYSPDDRRWVQQELWPWLEQAGLRVCIDLRDFQPGAPRPTEVERAVLTSRKMLLILTPRYLQSEWDEFGNLMLQSIDPAARQHRLIPLRKERCDLPPRLSFLWSIDFVEPADQNLAWTQLLTTLKAPLP